MASKNERRGRAVRRILLLFFTFIVAVLICALCLIYIFCKGPSPAIRDIFVSTVEQTSAAKFLAKIFLTEDEVAEIMEETKVEIIEETTDTELIVQDETLDMDAVIIEDIKGSTYKGKVMIVNDPSRVYLYTLPSYNVEKGKRVQEMAASQDALAGTNAGGFLDVGGQGSGSTPLGIVISRGVLRNGNDGKVHKLVGFDKDNKLIVGNMTANEALDMGIRDAAEWGPHLVVNGEAANVGKGGGGLNPRTAIGQRADGAVILVVIEGRQLSSMGASYSDLVDIMLKYEAVNASNMDGGTSSSMVYDGEVITSVCSLFGERTIPCAWLVEKR